MGTSHMSEPIFLSFCQARQELYPLLGLALVKADKSDSSIQCLCSSPAFHERWKKGQEEADGFLTGYDVGERRRKAKEKKRRKGSISSAIARAMRGMSSILERIKIRACF